MDPVAQQMFAPSKTMAATGSTTRCPRCPRPSTMVATPAMPMIRPSTSRPVGRRPCGRSQSTIMIHSGTEATTSAATPEGTVFWAQHTPPFPAISSSAPMTEA